MHALVVDDEHLIAQTVAEYLGRKGCPGRVASNGRQALEIFLSSHVDVVVTDLRMPEMGGLELIERLRKIGSDVPVLVLSGHIAAGDTDGLIRAGASAVLEKPPSLRLLLRQIKLLVGAAV